MCAGARGYGDREDGGKSEHRTELQSARAWGPGEGVWGGGGQQTRRKGTAHVQGSLRPTLISGAVLNCGGPLSRAPAALASLKLGVGELGGFTGSGTRRLGPPVLFPEPGATPPAPAEAAALGSFLGRREKRAQRTGGLGRWGMSQTSAPVYGRGPRERSVFHPQHGSPQADAP